MHTIENTNEWNRIEQTIYGNTDNFVRDFNELSSGAYKGESFGTIRREAVAKRVSENAISNPEAFLEHLSKYNTSIAYKLMYKLRTAVDYFGMQSPEAQIEKMLTTALEKQPIAFTEDGTGYFRSDSLGETIDFVMDLNNSQKYIDAVNNDPDHNALYAQVKPNCPEWLAELVSQVYGSDKQTVMNNPMLMDISNIISVAGHENLLKNPQHTNKNSTIVDTQSYANIENYVDKPIAAWLNRGTINIYLDGTDSNGNPYLLIVKPAKEVFSVLNKYAPISLSEKMIANGEYDNSGIIVKDHDEVGAVLFTLDLSNESVKLAKKLKCDTIVTHHPAIYYPIKNLKNDSPLSSPVLLAIKNGINVISMHLNLDVSEGGIDQSLSEGLGAKEVKILSFLTDKHGYGREFSVTSKKFSDYVKEVQKTFNTNKIVAYGKKDSEVNKVASFCGAGSSYAEKEMFKGTLKADTIVTSDMPHHDIKYFIDNGKKIIIIPHYASENYGFKKYYEKCAKELKINTHYFDDKRFF